MAVVKTFYKCPVCQQGFDSQAKAIRCKNLHPIKTEQWAVGHGGKRVRICEGYAIDSMYGLNWALREADLSDFIEVRKKQLAELEMKK